MKQIKKGSLEEALKKISDRANRKAFQKINAERKARGSSLLKFNPQRSYWI